MRCRRASLHSIDVQCPLLQIYLIPAEGDRLTDAQPVPIHHENQRGIAVSIAPLLLGSLDQ